MAHDVKLDESARDRLARVRLPAVGLSHMRLSPLVLCQVGFAGANTVRTAAQAVTSLRWDHQPKGQGLVKHSSCPKGYVSAAARGDYGLSEPGIGRVLNHRRSWHHQILDPASRKEHQALLRPLCCFEQTLHRPNKCVWSGPVVPAAGSRKPSLPSGRGRRQCFEASCGCCTITQLQLDSL